ncbi:MAG: 1-deoxy-D-xylulose-5-phosphate reductoisomerase [Lachnospiraceae bacterium]|nr:1-deoxy-D-xylulose-5-phosphate reductoisomerase [Lachnospiraceae bacterium]
MKNIAILGSTGSIGTQTLDIVRKNNDLKVISLSANSNVVLLEEQIREFMPKIVCVYDEVKAKELKTMISDLNVKVVSGMEGLIEISTLDEVDVVVTAIVGMIGIRPTIAVIKAKKNIALANKETLVTAGHIIIPLAKEYNVNIYPVDSEHSAIFQCLNGEKKSQIEKIILTASGGPFRGKTIEEMKNVTVEDALKHPNWAMGKKITIDSSTMVNKGLEVIEAKWLFDVDFDNIQVLIQPQSLIHSMVEFKDGSVMAQLGTPDMRLPIQYALYYPERRFLDGKRVNFYEISSITFEKPDMENFRALRLAFDAGRKGGSMPTVFNAANEQAVQMFLDKKIKYLDIVEMIEYAMENHKFIDNPNIDEILESEKYAYECIREKWD